MARTRYLKPSFFKDEDLAELPYEMRLFFEGLWGQADKEGRLEDRPRRLKIEIMPYDDVDIEGLLEGLTKPKKSTDRPFIVRYEVNGEKYIQILKWGEHQKPHHTEPESEIPPVPPTLIRTLTLSVHEASKELENGEKTVKKPLKNGDKTVKKPLNITNIAEEIYEVYKQEIKPGAKADGVRSVVKLLKEGKSKETLVNHIMAYKENLRQSQKTDPEYFIQFNNFFGRAERWKEFEPIKKKPSLKEPDLNCKVCKGEGVVVKKIKVLHGEREIKEICKCRKRSQP